MPEEGSRLGIELADAGETTLGLDLAARARKTAACLLRWGEACVVETLEVGVGDERALELLRVATISGLDAPFARYRSSGDWPGLAFDELRYRQTDFAVIEATGIRPLSPTADRIAVVAWRCAALLSRLQREGEQVDRRGRGRFVEVYPAAALKSWNLDARGYKARQAARAAEAARVRAKILDRMAAVSGWLALPDAARALLVADDDAFDAFVAALVARAARLRLTREPPTEADQRAAPEGWIHLPEPGFLPRLLDDAPVAKRSPDGGLRHNRE